MKTKAVFTIDVPPEGITISINPVTVITKVDASEPAPAPAQHGLSLSEQLASHAHEMGWEVLGSIRNDQQATFLIHDALARLSSLSDANVAAARANLNRAMELLKQKPDGAP